MNQDSDLPNPITKLSAKLKAEINEVEVRKEELKDKFDELQVEHHKILTAEEDVKAEHANLESKQAELEYRLQEVRNEI